MCCEVGDTVELLKFGEKSPDEVAPSSCSSAWVMCLSPYACIFGPSSLPLFGIGSLMKVVSGECVVYMQDISTVGGALSSYIDFLAKQDAGSDCCSTASRFYARHSDVFWMPYAWVPIIACIGEKACVPAQQPWLSKEMAMGEGGIRFGPWSLAKSWQQEYMSKRMAQLPWKNIGDGLRSWMP